MICQFILMFHRHGLLLVVNITQIYPLNIDIKRLFQFFFQELACV